MLPISFPFPFMAKAKSKSPIKNFYSNGVNVSIFANEAKTKAGESFTSYSVSLSRSYKLDGKTEYTQSLGESDLAVAHALILKAYFYIVEMRNEEAK